ncbi:bifunctional DNA primase/polymerase [Nocardia noduli]|uniref:bifunctional DNA primase/polymerase n=1 Tax=Nocardia noduli TaxID=2815722 RepID=UPI001C2396FF|nr:bifunctional DNA primase/polymerase [Nocardia noduli]
MTTEHPVPDPTPLLVRGLRLFPLPPGEKVAAAGWQHTLLVGDIDTVAAAWPEGANIGVGCRASGIVGIDLDRHIEGGVNAGADGVARFAHVCRRWGQPRPVTLEVATPNAGRHLYFRVPRRLTVASVSGGTSPLGPGIDIRGPGLRLGGYLAGPGSVIGDRAYTIETDTPIALLPGWLAALIGRRTR